ncbi:hypothetical protein GCM10027168_31660 [Streptomyces capparidis]
MARLRLADGHLVVRLSWWERGAAHGAAVRVPLTAVRRVRVERTWWRALRGERDRGRGIPGVVTVGLRRHPQGTDFAAVRAGRPVLCVDLAPDAPFARLALTVRHPERTAREVLAAAGRTGI